MQDTSQDSKRNSVKRVFVTNFSSNVKQSETHGMPRRSHESQMTALEVNGSTYLVLSSHGLIAFHGGGQMIQSKAIPHDYPPPLPPLLTKPQFSCFLLPGRTRQTFMFPFGNYQLHEPKNGSGSCLAPGADWVPLLVPTTCGGIGFAWYRLVKSENLSAPHARSFEATR